MKDKFPEIYKNKIKNIKSRVQKDYYYHGSKTEDEKMKIKKISKSELLDKIENLFKNKDFIYKADVTIMLKNGDNIDKRVISFKEGNLITLDNEKINIDDILDIK